MQYILHDIQSLTRRLFQLSDNQEEQRKTIYKKTVAFINIYTFYDQAYTTSMFKNNPLQQTMVLMLVLAGKLRYEVCYALV